MQYIIMFIAIAIISIVIAIKLKIRVEQAIPITVIGLVILVYLTGILGNLKIGIFLIYLIILISTIYLIYYLIRYKVERKSFINKYLTPGIAIYGLMYIIFVILNKNRIFENYDEFNHWGLIVKDMYLNDNFAFQRETVTLFNDYPPFTAIFEYILLKFSSSYSEDIIIIANNILAMSIMMPIFKKTSWDKNIIWAVVITPIIMCIPMIVFEKFYFNILVDGFMGLLIAYILYQWITNEDKIYRDISTGMGIVALVLTKLSGLGIALILILIMISECIHKRKSKISVKRELVSIIIISFVAILLFGIWDYNMEKNNQSRNWQMGNININSIIELLKGKEPEGKEGFVREFLKSIFIKEDITERNLSIVTSTIILLAINIYIYIYLEKDKKNRYKYYSICLYIFEILYIIYMILVYLFLFNIEETRIFSSYERYYGTIFIGILMFHILIGIEYKKEIDAKKTIVILSILISFLPIQVIREKIIAKKQDDIVNIMDRKPYTRILDYKDSLNENDKIYYIDVTPYKSKYTLQIMKYQMMPIKVDSEYRMRFNEKETIEILKRRGYTHLYIQELNESLKEEFEEKSIKNLEDKVLYKIIYEDEIIKLEKED